MNIKKYIFLLISMFIIISMILPYSVSAESTAKYGVLIGDKENKYTLYDNLIVLSPEDDVMVNAYSICKELGLSYSYDKEIKKLIIKNKDTGKSLVFTRDSKTYTYYSSKTDKGIKKIAEYKCYYDKASKSNVIHTSTLQFLLSYDFFQLSNEDDYYKDGYSGMAVYSKYEKIDELPNTKFEAIKSSEPRESVKFDAVNQGTIEDNQIIRFEDEKLLNEIKDYGIFSGGKGERYEGTATDGIYYKDIIQLKSCSFDLNRNSSTKGLEYAQNLEILNIELYPNYNPNMLKIIPELKNLKSLTINENDSAGLEDLSFLANTRIEYLKIVFSKSEDIILNINQLKELPQLKELVLLFVDSAKINMNISNLPDQLKSLIIKFVDCYGGVKIKLGVYKYLEDLNIEGYYGLQLKDIAKLTNLKKLTLNDCNLVNVDALKTLTSLTYLELLYNNLDNINLLKSMPQLQELYIGIQRNAFNDITPLLYLKKLKVLYLYNQSDKNDKNINVILKMRKQLSVLRLNDILIGYKKVKSSEKPIEELTPDVLKRLQSYPLLAKPLPDMSFTEMGKKYPDEQEIAYDKFIMKLKTEKNEKIFISKDCVCFTDLAGGQYIIRYVLQTTLKDGTIEEVFKECDFNFAGGDYDNPKLITVYGPHQISDTWIKKP